MRIRTALAVLGLAATVVTGTAGSAAAYSGGDHGSITANGNGSVQAYGNTKTGGNLSPQIGLIQGSLNKPCLAVPITLLNFNLLGSQQNQQCTENSSQTAGDGPLSHILSDDSLFSGNGIGNR